MKNFKHFLMPIPFGDSYEKDKEELFRQVEEYFSIMSFLAQPAHSSSEEEAKKIENMKKN